MSSFNLNWSYLNLHTHRSLLGISSGENEENHNNTPAVNGSDTTKRQPDPNRWNVSKKVPWCFPVDSSLGISPLHTTFCHSATSVTTLHHHSSMIYFSRPYIMYFIPSCIICCITQIPLGSTVMLLSTHQMNYINPAGAQHVTLRSCILYCVICSFDKKVDCVAAIIYLIHCISLVSYFSHSQL